MQEVLVTNCMISILPRSRATVVDVFSLALPSCVCCFRIGRVELLLTGYSSGLYRADMGASKQWHLVIPFRYAVIINNVLAGSIFPRGQLPSLGFSGACTKRQRLSWLYCQQCRTFGQ